MKTEYFKPKSLILINTVRTGEQRMCVVSDDGLGYFDIHGRDELPRPLLSDLNAIEVGDFNQWHAELAANGTREADAFLSVWEQLTEAGLDFLSIARGLYYAKQSKVYEVELLQEHAHLIQNQIHEERELIRGSFN